MDQYRDERMARVGIVLLVVASAALLAGYFGSCDASARERWRPADVLSVVDATRTIRCSVERQAASTYAVRAPKWYRPEQLTRYADASIRALQRQRWPDDRPWWHWSGTFLAIVYQQSKWVPNAVSRWNRDSEGNRIQTDPKRAWRAPDGRLDYGLFQVHWTTAQRMRPGIKLVSLANPDVNLGIGAAWLADRARQCSDWLKRDRVRCGRRSESIACRCKLSDRYLGGMYWTAYKNVLSAINGAGEVVRGCWSGGRNESEPRG